jgi:hypothetical protein
MILPQREDEAGAEGAGDIGASVEFTVLFRTIFEVTNPSTDT